MPSFISFFISIYKTAPNKLEKNASLIYRYKTYGFIFRGSREKNEIIKMFIVRFETDFDHLIF